MHFGHILVEKETLYGEPETKILFQGAANQLNTTYVLAENIHNFSYLYVMTELRENAIRQFQTFRTVDVKSNTVKFITHASNNVYSQLDCWFPEEGNTFTIDNNYNNGTGHSPRISLIAGIRYKEEIQ